MFIFKRIKSHSDEGFDKFEQIHRHVVKDIPIFTKVCMNYHFKHSNTSEKDTIIFCKIDEIFELMFNTAPETPPVITTRYKFTT